MGKEDTAMYLAKGRYGEIGVVHTAGGLSVGSWKLSESLSNGKEKEENSRQN